MAEISLGQLELMCRLAGKTIDEVTAPVIKETALRVKATQEERVPYATGKTKRSIRATGPEGAQFTKATTEALVGPTWWVGMLLERGTATRAPRPFVAGSADPHMAGHRERILKAVMRESFKGMA